MDLKVPISNAAPIQSRQQQPQYTNFDFNDGTAALQRGIGEAAQGVEDVQGALQRRAAKAKQQADEIAGDSLKAQLQQGFTETMHGKDLAPKPDPGQPGYDNLTEEQINSVGAPGARQPGYLDTQGNEAHEKSADALKAIQDNYERLSKLANNKEQKKILQEHFLTLQETARSQIAIHEGQQFRVAAEASTRGLTNTTLDSASALYNDQEHLSPMIDNAVASIKRTSLPEEFEAKKGDFLAKVSAARIGAYLEHQDLRGASDQFTKDREVLGGAAPQVDANIKRAFEVQDKKLKAANDEAFIGNAVQAARATTAEAFVDEAKVRATIEAAPEDKRTELRALGEHALKIATEQKKAVLDDWRNKAQGAFNQGGLGAIPADIRLKIHTYDAEFEHKLLDEAHKQFERSKQDARDPAADKAQKAADDKALADFRTIPQADRAKADVGAFLMGRGVSDVYKSKIAEEKTKAGDALNKGDLTGETEFRQAALAKAAGQIGGDKEKAKAVAAEAVKRYGELRDENGGAKPTTKQVTEATNELVKNVAIERGPVGKFFGLSPTVKPKWELDAEKARESANKVVEETKPPPARVQNQQALDWAHAHPDDPRSAAILKKLGVK